MNNNDINDIVAEAHRHINKRNETYRAKALKMFSWICGRCGREFNGKRLSELTVHHKDHNHNNNPSDGSNWELLCTYCHDNEHSRYKVAESYLEEESSKNSENHFFQNNPFSKLNEMIKNKFE